jgi:hypothetical protein
VSSPAAPQNARPRWAVPLLAVLVLAAFGLGGFEIYAGHYQPLAGAGYLKPVPSSTVHRIAGSGSDFTGPAGAHLQLEFGLLDSGPFDVDVSAVSALPGSTARWAAASDSSGPTDPAAFRAFGATVPARSGIRVLLDLVVPACSAAGTAARPSSFDMVTVHWSALGRRHSTRLPVIGDVPISLCGPSGG